MTITYSYGKNLYVNTTNRCDMHCDFCLRQSGDGVGEADSLWLEREPTREEIWEDIQKRDRQHKLDQTVDALRQKFGDQSVVFAHSVKKKDKT